MEVMVNGQQKTKVRKKVVFSSETRKLTAANIRDCLPLIKYWERYCPKEKTWAQKECGVASLFFRVDCHINGVLVPFQIDTYPKGIGYLKEIHRGFPRALKDAALPEMKFLSSGEPTDLSDPLWIDQISEAEAMANDMPLLIKVGEEGKVGHRFESRSVTSLRPIFKDEGLNLKKRRHDLTFYRLFFVFNLNTGQFESIGGLAEDPTGEEEDIVELKLIA